MRTNVPACVWAFCRLICGITTLLVLTRLNVSGQQTRSLSIEEAVRLAQSRSALARTANARIAGAEARLQGAGALTNPSLILAQPIGKNTGGLDEDILATQTFELGDKRRQRIRAAQADRNAALADRTGSSSDIAYSAQSAYIAALLSDEEQALAQDALKNSQTFAKAAQTQFDAGEAPRSNLLRSRVEVVRAEQALTAAQTDRENRYATLRSLLSLPDGSDLTLTDTLGSSIRSYSLENLLTLAVQNRADLRSAQQIRESRIAAYHSARAQTQPDLILEARHSTLDPSVGGSSLRIGISLPILDFGRVRADTRSANAAVQEQDAIIAELQRTIRLDVATAYRTMEQARKTVATFQSGRLSQAQELQKIAEFGYSEGQTSYLELLDAQRLYRMEQADFARAQAAYLMALAALQHAVGGRLP